jgi:hypothetical protein
LTGYSGWPKPLDWGAVRDYQVKGKTAIRKWPRFRQDLLAIRPVRREHQQKARRVPSVSRSAPIMEAG